MIRRNFKINRGLVVSLLITVCGFFGCFAQEMPALDSTRKLINPRAALIRSAIIPGWGQLYVHKPVKAAIYVFLEVYHLYQFNEYNSIYKHIKETKATIGLTEWNKMNENDKKIYESIEEKRKAKILEVTGYKLNDATWRPREKRNKYAWWSMGFYLICMLDAYVDAHLYYFPAEKVELTAALKPNGIELNLLFNFRK